MKFRTAALAGVVGVGMAVAPLASANAATPKTYPLQVTLTGNACHVKGLKLSNWNATIETANFDYSLGATHVKQQDVMWANTNSKTHTFQSKYTGNMDYILVQTWCGKGPFAYFAGKAADTCFSIPAKTDKKHPYKLSVNMDSGTIGAGECGLPTSF